MLSESLEMQVVAAGHWARAQDSSFVSWRRESGDRHRWADGLGRRRGVHHGAGGLAAGGPAWPTAQFGTTDPFCGGRRTFSWLNLPALDVPQYLLTIAQFDELGEYLRFRPGADSAYRQMWSGIPQRRQEAASTGTVEVS